jgi:FHA domain
MSVPQEPLRLDNEDLFSPRVDAYLEERDALARGMTDIPRPALVLRVIYASWFYLAVAGGLGAFTAWALLEPFLDDTALVEQRASIVAGILLFPTVAAFVGLFLGAAEGLMCRNPRRAFLSAMVGLGIGFGGGLLAFVVASIVFVIMVVIAVKLDPGIAQGQGRMPRGFALLVFMMGRGAAWAVAAIPAGIGQGIALGERKVILNGLLGAILGGLLGGLLFDPIDIFMNRGNDASLSRAVGLTVIGIFVGLFVGLVEQWTRTAWLLMRAGPLAGKQFVLHRNPTVLGSSPKADVYLFKDAAIEPRHALIHNLGGRFEIEDCDSPDGTYVNGIPVKRQVLQAGDQIVLGKTVLEFAIKESK